jgi:hypothetical protein
MPRHVDAPGLCELVGVGRGSPLDPQKPTVVLTHGWSQTDQVIGDLWSSDQVGHAKNLIRQATGSRLNVVQVFWHGSLTSTWSTGLEYAEAKAQTVNAGLCVAQLLTNELRAEDYAQPIQFIGHSLGSVVSTYAAYSFLAKATYVPSARLTVLDFPGRTTKAFFWGFIEPDNIPADFFATTLSSIPRVKTGALPVSIDNYYAKGAKAVGLPIPPAANVDVYNHPTLDEPGKLAEDYVTSEYPTNDHSGVQLWYRLTIAPERFGIDCARPLPKSIRGSLNPCHAGWPLSELHEASSVTDDSQAPATMSASFSLSSGRSVTPRRLEPAITTLPLLEFAGIQGCQLTTGVVACQEGTESQATAWIDVPAGGRYLSFDYQFTNAEGREYAAVFVDDESVWMTSAINAPGGLRSSGPLSIPSGAARRTLTILFYGAGAGTASFELSNVAVQEGQPEATFLAEGATGPFFDTQVALLNPSVDPVSVRLAFQRRDGVQIDHSLTLPPTTRTTIAPKEIAGLGDAEFSTHIESNGQVVVDRTMAWDAAHYGSHAERGVPAPSLTWYLAEGATHGTFTLFYLLQNPDLATSADVRVRYLLPSAAPIVRTYTLAPGSRTTIMVDGVPGLEEADVSGVIEVQNGVPIIAERAMYLNRPGEPFAGGHESAGVTQPSTRWFLAEGATGPFFDLFILIANPGDEAADIRVTYLLPAGTTVERTYQVAANSRFTIYVGQDDPRLRGTAVSTTVESTNGVPVIAERAMWWPAGDWREGHNSPGATETGTRWALAEGEDGGEHQMQTYILIANTSSFAGAARVTIAFEDGATTERVFALNPTSRFNVPVGRDFPEAAGRRFGAIVESLGAVPAEIVVERAMYSNANGVSWAAGTNALATRLPD